ncbi:MAG: hypothetical protein IPH20_14570 [Bacteroidales bacterium]|nr:hypothetical protein [Bacteroidales bacterium]
MILLECEYCGDSYQAERISSKYCSDSCKSMAYRKRKVDYEQALIALQQKKLIDQAHEKWLAEFNEKNRLESINRQERLEQEMNERLRKAEVERQERKEKYDKERALKRKKHEQRMAEIERENSQNELTAILLGGLANRIIENLSKKNSKKRQDNS